MIFDENHPHIAVIYDNIGCVYADLQNYNKALTKYMKSLEIRSRTLKANDAYMAGSLYDLGYMLRGLKFYEDA